MLPKAVGYRIRPYECETNTSRTVVFHMLSNKNITFRYVFTRPCLSDARCVFLNIGVAICLPGGYRIRPYKSAKV